MTACVFLVGRSCFAYTHVRVVGKAGEFHSALVRSDGSAVAWGSNRLGQCNIPDLVEGVTYTQVDAGDEHTVLSASDVTAAACG